MAQKPNKKATQGKPVYKARQPQSAATAAGQASSGPVPAKGEPINWH